jgi:CBS domain containing-hemolysin-like protein
MACDSIISFFGLNMKKEPTLTEEEFKTVMEVGHRHGVVGKSEKEMVVSILELTTTTAQEVMTPRMDIKAISDAWDRDKAVSFAKQIRHSKLPVYKDYYDNIFGVIFTRELFLEEAKTLTELIKPVMFVPETKKISDLIMEFYRQKAKIAIVVDEHGGTAGLVTLEDVLEEIFGEIHDGSVAIENLIELLGINSFRVIGKAPIYKVNDDCGLSIAQGDYDTLAGFLLYKFGKIPQEGERIEAAGAVFTIEKVLGRRIKSVLVEKK